VWLAKVNEQLGLCEVIACQVPESRTEGPRLSLLTLVRQRVYHIACGYEDQDDADALRKDPLADGSIPH
jgi:hypothetical protein